MFNTYSCACRGKSHDPNRYRVKSDFPVLGDLNLQDVWVVRPGDYVALIHKDRMTDQARHRAKTVLEERWPDVRCVLFEGDWDPRTLVTA